MRDTTDDALLRLVADALDHTHPVPEDAVEAARAAFGLGSVEADVARLVYDSLRDEPKVLLRAGDERHRALSFEAGSTVVELEVLDDRRTVIGQIEPPQAMDVVIESPAERSTVRTDELGRFRAAVPSGPFRICLTATNPSTVTPWITG